jgi:hypothetical protein
MAGLLAGVTLLAIGLLVFGSLRAGYLSIMRAALSSPQPAIVMPPAETPEPATPVASAETSAPSRFTPAPESEKEAAGPTAAVVVATPPPAPAAPDAASGNVLLDAQFSQPIPGWRDDPKGPATFLDGVYRLVVRQANHFVAVGVPLGAPPRNILVTARFRKLDGPPGSGYGVIFRDQSPESRDGDSQAGRYYVAELGDKGEVGLWQRDVDHWVDLVPWTHAEAVRTGTLPNDLQVRAVDDQITVIVNSVEVLNVVGATLLEGGVGVYAGGDLNQVALEHLLVQSVP